MSSFIGPALPPHLQRKEESSESRDETSKSNENQMKQTSSERHADSCDALIGPSMLPELVQTVNHPFSSVPEPTTKRNVQAPEIGPSLPPHLCAASHDAVIPPESEYVTIGPALPPHLRKGPRTDNQLESHSSHMTSVPPFAKETDKDDDSSVLILDAGVSDEEAYRDDPQDEMYGPALPPGLRVGYSRSTKEHQVDLGIMGPCLPPGMKLSNSADHGSSDSDTDVIGPMPAPEGADNSTYLQDQLDARALRMKRKLAQQDEGCGSGPMKRESWMLELPPDRAAVFGLGPRQFQVRATSELGDRSVWTDTPADHLRKKLSPGDKSDAVNELNLRAIEERDKEMQQLAKKHSGKKRQESLLEAHQKEMKKKRKKEKEDGKQEERRPFDRNTDLQANRFDKAQKKAIFKKAQQLNDRFSSGQSKFL